MTVFTAVVLVLWDVAQHNLLRGYEYFRATYCLQLWNHGPWYTNRPAIIYRTACGHISEDRSFKLWARYTSEMIGANQLSLCVVYVCTKCNHLSLFKNRIQKLVNNAAICAVLCQAGFTGKCDIHI